MKQERLPGHWWLPSAPERRVAGTLAYEPDGHPELDLMETLSNDPASIESSVVLGLSVDAEPVTVEVEFETNRPSIHTRQGHRVVRQAVAVRRAIVGAHLPSEADRRFARLSVEFTDLLSWTGWRGPEDDWDGGVRSIRYVEPEEFKADTDWGVLRLRHSWAVDGDGISVRSIRVGAGFVCERESAASIETWLDEVVRPLRDFMSIATDRANQVEAVTVEWAEREPYAGSSTPRHRSSYPHGQRTGSSSRLGTATK